ncbi:MAG: DUF4037 domain-containing protein [Clostridiales bacterium]|nr:DUF4037 domain-containing protein [Clostridiales bacterium]
MRYIKGLELSREFYHEYGLPMLLKEFGEEMGRIAAGLTGHGSECFGFDDEVSSDHDLEPGFCIWLTDEDDREFGFRLMRAYMKLPKEYKGLKLKESSIYGTRGRGVHTIWDFYSYYLGMRRLPVTPAEWLRIPPFYLAEATNGEVFSDPLGEFTKIREEILHNVPEDVWKKRLASDVFEMAQKGQYNYDRCLRHGEKGAAVLSLNGYINALISAVYIINRAHMPYYKWALRAISDLGYYGNLKDDIEKALTDPLNAGDFIGSSSSLIKDHLVNSYGLKDTGDYLEGYSYGINDLIEDHDLRNSPVML